MRLPLLLALAIGLAGCSSSPTAPVSSPQPLNAPLQTTFEDVDALNVSITAFEVTATDVSEANVRVREAEARYLPTVLKRTLVDSGYWGAVRVVPEQDPTAEVTVQGKLLHSDGVKLSVHIVCRDSVGRIWIDKTYTDYTIDHAYAFPLESGIEPFQDLFNSIANDMSEVFWQLSRQDRRTILNTATLRYAVALAPEVFSTYLNTNEQGLVQLAGLPASNDAMFNRVHRIREAEYTFIDTLDEQYTALRRDMQIPYGYWRRYGFELLRYNQEIENDPENRRRSADNFDSMKAVYELYQESKLNEDELRELADSLDNEVGETVAELEGRVVRLTGSIENQYDEWRSLLRQIYSAETAD